MIVCLIGLFAMASGDNQIAVGPLALMIILLVFTILYHMSMNSAMEPLLNYLPKNLEHEEELLLAEDRTKNSYESHTNGVSHGFSVDNGVSNIDSGVGAVDSAEAEKGLGQSSSSSTKKQPNFLTKFFRPDKYADYATLRRYAPSADDIPPYPEEAERNAYFNPAINAKAPLLWIPRDPLGISRQEVAHSSRVIPITDEDAFVNENAKITWDEDKGQPPVYEEKIAW